MSYDLSWAQYGRPSFGKSQAFVTNLLLNSPLFLGPFIKHTNTHISIYTECTRVEIKEW